MKASFNPTTDLERFLRYMQFKLECAAYQEANPVRLDYDKAHGHMLDLEALQEEKVEQLKQVMPYVPVYKKQNKPKITHKKDGTLSAHGEKWFKILKEHKLPPTHKDPINILVDHKEANPNSSDQVKAWLFSLGWKPTTYKFLRDKNTGNERKIEQVRKDGELCPSVIELKDKYPDVEILEGLTVIQHRLGIFKAFVGCAVEKDGVYYLKAEIGGLTNTLRFKHQKPLVNLPGVDKPYGEEIRSCLIAPQGYEVMGSDLVSLEDTTKRHYMKPLDPDYVETMLGGGYDPHMMLLVVSGDITKEDYDFYVSYKDEKG